MLDFKKEKEKEEKNCALQPCSLSGKQNPSAPSQASMAPMPVLSKAGVPSQASTIPTLVLNKALPKI